MSERIDFSANATIYDRRHGAAVSDDGLDRLWVAAGLRAGGRVLDIGAGTGRVAIPLALRGCHVVAVEPARGMLDELRAKAGESKVQAVIAEGSRLPFPAGHFDCVVIARLLYLTPDWQAILREVHRVLARRGCFLHEWGNGHAAEEWVQIREEARRLFEEAGLRAPFHPGARSEADIDGQVGLLQFVREASVDMAPARRSRSANFFGVSSKASCRTSGVCLKTCGAAVFPDSSAGPRRCSISIGPFRCLEKFAGSFIERFDPLDRARAPAGRGRYVCRRSMLPGEDRTG